MKKIGYEYFQPNELDVKDEFYDAPVRAICILNNVSWLEAFDDIVRVARKLQCSFNNKECYEYYFKERGYVYTGVSNKKGSKRPTVDSFARSHTKGKYLLRIAHHCIPVVNGVYYDTWDYGKSSLYGYWSLPEELWNHVG